MFRTQANAFEEVVVKATSEDLVREDWALILDVCDKVTATSNGPQQVAASLIKRLAHRNANVQLYTLELANALTQNCGVELQRELASRSFTDALLRLAGDRNTHPQVKAKVMERMGEWSEMFRGNPDLGIMDQAYGRLRQMNPGLQAPSKPVKSQITSEDRRKEDDELQMALALSIKEKGKETSTGGGATNGTVRDDSEPQPAQAQPGAAQGTTAATVSRVRALYDFTPSESGELAFRKNDIIAVLESVYKDWWKGSLRGQTGIFPLNYVEKLQDPTREELERDAAMEGDVFAEIRNVEKLLALLSVRGEAGGGQREGEEEISELYQRTLSIRPKLIELIGKYSQKKDDFTQLNEKFIKARRDYEALLESSMSAPQHQYPIQPRQSSAPLYAHNQYAGPQPQQHQGYPPQQHHQPSYPPQSQPVAQASPYAPQQQQHMPPQQDTQRLYSPAPSEPPQPSGYPPYQQPQHSSAQQPANGPAPFMFIPGGLPPQQQQGGPPPQQEAAPQQRTPKPLPPQSGPADPYGPGGGQFNGQIRPQSIHTLNSGNPQELATGGYEPPIDNRHSYPPAQIQSQLQQPPTQPPQQPYESYHQQQPGRPPQQQQYAVQTKSDRDALPSRQRTHSFESPASSLYSPHQDGPYPTMSGQPQPHQQHAPQPGYPPQQPQSYDLPQPSAPPPGVPISPQMQPQQYQAYNPAPMQQPSMPSHGSEAGGGPHDFYR